MADLHENEENIEDQGTHGEGAHTEDTHEEETLDPQLKKWLVIAAVVLVLVFLGILGYQYLQEEKQRETVEASERLIRVQQLMADGRFDEALAGSTEIIRGGEPIMGYEDIAEKHKGIEAGKTAALNAGKIYSEKGQYAEAEKFFDIALNSDVLITKMGASAGMAAAKESKGDNAAAAALYSDAANMASATSIKQKYTYFAGLNYSLAGERESAEKLLNRAIMLSPGSQWANMARAELGMHGMKIAQ